MLYDFQYDLASFIAGCFLLIVYLLRRSFKTKSNYILGALIICNLFGAAFDFVSCFCISYPQNYPMWFCYFISLGYIFFYNMMGVLFYLYFDSRAKVEKLWKPTKYIAAGIIIFEAVIIFTSPLTHMVAYFTPDLKYHHGPLMPVLYALALITLILTGVCFSLGRRRFNAYQIIAIVSFFVVIFVCVIIQLFNKRALVGQLGCTLVIFFIYTALENPVYFNYKQTTCFNRNSFLHIVKRNIRHHKSYSLIIFAINDYDDIKRNLTLKNQERLSSRIATFINSNFGKKGFVLDDDKFAILVEKTDDILVIGKKIEAFFDHPIPIIDNEIMISVNHHYIEDIDPKYNIDNVEMAIHQILDTTASSDTAVNFVDIIDNIQRRKDISHLLRRAIKSDGFEMFYQPIREVATGKYISMEALVRLKDKSLGYISPEEFIPIAEQNGIINDIGDIVFRKVCQFMKNIDYHKLGIKYVEINLSPIQCISGKICSKFHQILEHMGINPECINLEITETASFDDSQMMKNNIEKFHSLGCSFSLDDFGSGFASVNYLLNLPVEIVKIDKSILWQAMKNNNAMIVLDNTISMLKKLEKRIVVEGVEDEDMVKLLTDMGVHYLQGYYYSKPLSEQDFVAFINKSMNPA